MSVCTTVDMTESTRNWTPEQREAIERREGDLLVAAGAGSGKTSVLVERFVRSVVQDGIDPGAILTITFTEKAAAEMRDRIRLRLRELGEDAAAAATEEAPVSTIHGFCARVLRAHALGAGLDPAFAVLDEPQARRLADAAFAQALEELAQADTGTIDLIAGHGAAALRAGTVATYGELRSRGVEPELPPLPPAPELGPALAELRAAAATVAAELGAVEQPGVKVQRALERVGRCGELTGGERPPWPGDLDVLALPGGNGAALSTEACAAYTAALERARDACAHGRALHTHSLLARLLKGFAARYAEAKRAVSGLDFEDLELLTRDLLRRHREVRERYRARFARVMVDELQDTNQVQLELIDAIANGNLFTVGDAQQAIYGFRHADVELFERLARERREQGRYGSLQANFRSRREILDILNATFAEALGERFTPLVAGREDEPAADPRVELLVVDKGADWQEEGLAAPWRLAEARALSERVARLVGEGTAARDIVVLTRATTDLRTYERALENRGVPTYLIGGRGYWGHPQVLDLVAYLRLLANPQDEESLWGVLASPLVGVSYDALVLVSGAARAGAGDPWTALRAGGVQGLASEDRQQLESFVEWFTRERGLASRIGAEELIDRVLEHTGYDVAVLGYPDGRRRVANVRKLMRLAREHEAAHGPELRGFLELVAERSRGLGGDARESEAPVEGEALDAVRLMTIHRSKGLEFDTVCVADLGRVRRTVWDLIRVGRDGRLGLRIAEPGTGRALPALAYRALGDERTAREEAEERRLYYVAMTRARERLVLTGAARLDAWPEGNGGTAIGWIASALIPEFGEAIVQGRGVSERGVAFAVLREGDAGAPVAAPATGAVPPPAPPVTPAPPADAAPTADAAPSADTSPTVETPPPLAPDAPPLALAPLPTLSYSALAAYERCGYRFYVERLLGVPGPPVEVRPATAGTPSALPATARGVIAHALLERLDFRRPLDATPEAIAAVSRTYGVPAPGEVDTAEIAGLVRAFARSELCTRLANATQVQREQRFTFALPDGTLLTGALDVLAREREGMLVVDYKSDRLTDTDPRTIVRRAYAVQQLIYAIAVLRSGAELVHVAHVFLERPDEPVLEAYSAGDAPELEARLLERTRGVRERRFTVTAEPLRAVCAGCPAEGGLCSWPVEVTRRERPDQLF